MNSTTVKDPIVGGTAGEGHPDKPAKSVRVKDSPAIPVTQVSPWEIGNKPPPGEHPQSGEDVDHARPFARGPPVDVLDVQLGVHRIISTVAAAHVLGLSPDTLERMSRRREGPPRIKMSPRRCGYRLADCLKYIEERRVALNSLDSLKST
jgi:hypothetical protein